MTSQIVEAPTAEPASSWVWLDYVHSNGTSRYEFENVKSCLDYLSENPSIEHYKITAQEADEIIIDSGYDQARAKWLDCFQTQFVAPLFAKAESKQDPQPPTNPEARQGEVPIAEPKGYMRPCESCLGAGTIEDGDFVMSCNDCGGTGIHTEHEYEDPQPETTPQPRQFDVTQEADSIFIDESPELYKDGISYRISINNNSSSLYLFNLEGEDYTQTFTPEMAEELAVAFKHAAELMAERKAAKDGQYQAKEDLQPQPLATAQPREFDVTQENDSIFIDESPETCDEGFRYRIGIENDLMDFQLIDDEGEFHTQILTPEIARELAAALNHAADLMTAYDDERIELNTVAIPVYELSTKSE